MIPSAPKAGIWTSRRRSTSGGTGQPRGPKAAGAAIKETGSQKEHRPKPESEKHPAKDAGDPSDTPRKGGQRAEGKLAMAIVGISSIHLLAEGDPPHLRHLRRRPGRDRPLPLAAERERGQAIREQRRSPDGKPEAVKTIT